MNPIHNDFAQHSDWLPSDAETQLEISRAALRQRLERKEADRASAPLGNMGGMVRIATPVARQWVRRHPYASLSAAALTGAALARWKPWRGLGGSLLAGLLARQALTLSLSSGGRVFDWLLDALSSKPDTSARSDVKVAARDLRRP
ncbi:MAG: hypothetical protein GZ085_01235 [Sulfuriferula multivorans]|uniref:Uncharacterized protein n=1 Tax=Sulfuriferula multivorans TaxID=1559896 RepID=A0A7C9K7U5_9PROT|nr:hypothetical protein [Sulfuriferula multivorans]